MATLNLTAPTGWADLSQQQLITLLKVMVSVNHANNNRRFRSIEDYSAQSAAQVATICLFRWNNLRVITPYADAWLVAQGNREYILSADDIAAATGFLDWMKELPDSPVRIARVDGADAVATDLDDGFSFDNWLSVEAFWQHYQVTKADSSLRAMAEILYRRPGLRLKEHESLGVFYWWAGVKAMCNRLFPNFFQPAPLGSDAQPSEDSLRRSMDAQIRALTKGDISKEPVILALPAMRALTELDALAREYDELNRKYGSK